MIIIISGGIGSGKTITAVRHVIENSKNNKVFTNFTLKNVNYHRIKNTDVFTYDDKNKINGVNWEFWKENAKGSDIFLDELHNIVSSRRAMSKKNVHFSDWLAQIRKIMGQTGDQNHLEILRRMNNNAFYQFCDKIISNSNNLYLITQRPRRIDINFRELSHCYIQCQKQIIDGEVIIFNKYWFGDDNYSALEYHELGEKPKITFFAARPYFNKYDSYEMISTGGEYL